MAPSSTRLAIKVPKEMHGKVIGRGGATRDDIESDYPGVKVIVPKRDDPSDEIILEGPADAVKHAEARVLDICGMAPDISGGARAEAQRLYDEVEALFKQSREADSREEANRLKSLANAKRKEAERANQQAAERIFAAKNAGYGNDQMDLHGLQVKEALQFVNDRLVAVDSDLRSGALPSLTIITGAGHHSVGNKAKIKPEVRDILTNGNYPFEEDEAGGMFVVAFKDAMGGPRPEAAKPTEPQGAPNVSVQQQPVQPQPHQPAHQPEGEAEANKGGVNAIGLAIAFCACLFHVCTSKAAPTPEENVARSSAGDANGAQSEPPEQEMHRIAQV